MSRRTLFPSPVAWLALVASFVIASVATAQPAPTSTWIGTASDNWSNGANWKPAGAPNPDPTATALQFNASGTASYTATNDIADPFQLKALYLNSSSSNPITIAGNVGGTLSGAVSFGNAGSGNPAYLLQNGSGAVNITATIYTNNNSSSGGDLQLGGTGSGTVTISGMVTGPDPSLAAAGQGALAFNNTGGATFILNNTANQIAGSGLVRGIDVDTAGGNVVLTNNNNGFLQPTTSGGGGAGTRFSAGTLTLAPSGSGQAVEFDLNVATDITQNSVFQLNAGGTLVLNKGSNTSLTTGINLLSRATGSGSSGTLVITPASGVANFGTASGETFEVYNATYAQANINSMVVPVLVVQNSATNSNGDFMNYNGGTTAAVAAAFGQFANYTPYSTSGGSFSTSTAGTEVSNVTANTTASANATLMALRVTSSTLTINSGSTVTVAGGQFSTGYTQAGLILNSATITGGNLTFANSVTGATHGTEADVYTSAGTSTINSLVTITNDGTTTPGLVKFGPGNLLLTNSANVIQGTISIYGGNVAINGSGNTDATGLGTGAVGIIMRGGGGFQLASGSYAPPVNKTFGIATGGGTFEVDGTGNTLTLAQSGQFTAFAGSSQLTPTPLYKTGTGALALSNSTFSLSGLTIAYVQQGSLLFNAATAGAVPVIVNSGGTLGGTGSIAGVATVNSGGTIAPGTASTVAAFGTGGAVFMPGGTYNFKYNPVTTSPVAGTDNDEITSSGALDLTNLSSSGKFTINLASLPGVSGGSPVTYAAGAFGSVLLPAGVTSSNLSTVFNFTGNFTGAAPTASLSGNTLDFTFTPLSSSTFTWTGGTSGNWSVAGNWSPASIPPSSVNTQLIFGATTHAAMTNDVGPLTLNSMTFNSGAPAYTLGGSGSNALTFATNSLGALPSIVTNSANGAIISLPVVLSNNLNVSGSGTVTLAGAVSGAASINMNGTGIFALTSSSNSFSGGVNINSGTVQVSSDAALGSGPFNISTTGTLAYAATTTTTKSFPLNGGTLAVTAGQTLTLSGSQVTNGFLDGAGTFATSASNAASFVGVTATPSVAIVSNNTNDQFVHFVSSAAFSLAAGVNTGGSLSPTNLSGFTNQGLGSVTIGAGSQLNVSNFQSYGMLNLTPATVSGQFTELANVGISELGFNTGSESFVGTAAAPNANVVGVDLHGQNMVIQGGLFVNNGLVFTSTGSSTVFVDYGATYKGAGTTNVPIVTQNGGKVLFGNCPGVATFGTLVIGSGGIGNLEWEINDAGPSATYPSASGVAGPSANASNRVSGWSMGLVAAQTTRGSTANYGNLSWTATPSSKFNLDLETLAGPSTLVGSNPDGLMADFDPTQSYSWPIITYQGIYSGPTSDAQLTADTVFDRSLFANALPAGSEFGLHLDQFPTGGGELDLVFTPSPVPEPGTLALTGLAGLAAGWVARRRRAKLAAV